MAIEYTYQMVFQFLMGTKCTNIFHSKALQNWNFWFDNLANLIPR
jgi:hypothetical protein